MMSSTRCPLGAGARCARLLSFRNVRPCSSRTKAVAAPDNVQEEGARTEGDDGMM